MSRSENISELATALAKAQGAFSVAVFDKTNPHFKNGYASLSSIHAMIREPLRANGLSVTHMIDDGRMSTTLLHTSGQWISCDIALPVGGKPQEFGSALTYFRRYSLTCLLAIPTGEDEDDAEEAQKKAKFDMPVAVVRSESINGKLISEEEELKIENLIGNDPNYRSELLKNFSAMNPKVANCRSFSQLSITHLPVIYRCIKTRHDDVAAGRI